MAQNSNNQNRSNGKSYKPIIPNSDEDIDDIDDIDDIEDKELQKLSSNRTPSKTFRTKFALVYFVLGLIIDILFTVVTVLQNKHLDIVYIICGVIGLMLMFYAFYKFKMLLSLRTDIQIIRKEYHQIKTNSLKLEEQNKRYSAAIIILNDTKLRLQYANNAYKRLQKYEQERNKLNITIQNENDTNTAIENDKNTIVNDKMDKMQTITQLLSVNKIPAIDQASVDETEYDTNSKQLKIYTKKSKSRKSVSFNNVLISTSIASDIEDDIGDVRLTPKGSIDILYSNDDDNIADNENDINDNNNDINKQQPIQIKILQPIDIMSSDNDYDVNTTDDDNNTPTNKKTKKQTEQTEELYSSKSKQINPDDSWIQHKKPLKLLHQLSPSIDALALKELVSGSDLVTSSSPSTSAEDNK